jgi:hypothetical protein
MSPLMYIVGGNCGEVEGGGATSDEGERQGGAADGAFTFQALSESTERKVLHFCLQDEMMETLRRATETAEKSEAIALQLREQVRSKAQMLLIDLKAVEVAVDSLSHAENFFSTDENLGHEDLELSCSTDQKTPVDVLRGSRDGCEASVISRSRLGSMTATCSFSALRSELGREHHLQDDSNSCKGQARLQSKVSKGSATLCSAVTSGQAHPTATLKLALDMRAAGQQGSLRRAAFNVNLATDLANVCIVNASVIVLCAAFVFVCLFACVRAQG